MREKYLYTGHCGWVVGLVQTAFRDCILSTYCTWKMAVILKRGNGDFRGIGLVEVLWNTISGMITRHIQTVIN